MPWIVLCAVAAVAFLGFVVLEYRTARSDGDVLKTHPFRTLMFHIMPTRSESIVFFDSPVDATE